MYTRYAERQRWKVEVALRDARPTAAASGRSSSRSRGKGAYSHLRYESGVHRVQRVPVTESQGRIHTSTASVAVLPEAEEVDIQIDDNDLRIDVYRSTGHGGQSVNTTDSAVRITHLPTGHRRHLPGREEPAQEQAQGDDRPALAPLRHRAAAARRQERGDARRSQIGSGERSEKIRTYNFPQDRDHRPPDQAQPQQHARRAGRPDRPASSRSCAPSTRPNASATPVSPTTRRRRRIDGVTSYRVTSAADTHRQSPSAYRARRLARTTLVTRNSHP